MERILMMKIAAGTALMAFSVLAGWRPGEPVTTYWAGPGYPGDAKLDDRWAAQLKEGGFNTTWATTPEELDVAARHGLRVIYKYMGRLGDVEDPASMEEFAKAIDKVKDHPALYVYSLRDEPPATRFNALARYKEWIAARDPNHATWINLLPTYANNKQLGVEGDIFRAYWEHVRMFAEIFHPEFLSYDHYQFINNGDNPNYLLNLSVIRQSAASQGVPFWNGVQACTWRPGSLASPTAPRIPGPDELRFLVYTTVAYGAQGIYYYVYCHKGHKGSIVSQDGTPGPNFEALKTLNREFVSIARELAPLRFAGAYVDGVRAPGVTPWCDRALLKITPETPACELVPKKEMVDSTLVTRFEGNGTTYLMVVNLDYRKDRTLNVTAPCAVEMFNALKRTWSPMGGSTFDLSVIRGGGMLMRLAKQ